MSELSYRTDAERLEFLDKRIRRLETTLERLESLGMTSVSSAGTSKTFRDQESIRQELERAEREYLLIKSRVEGQAVNPHFKEMIICNRRHY